MLELQERFPQWARVRKGARRGTVVGVAVLRGCCRFAARVGGGVIRRPRQTLPHAELLDQPVRLPEGDGYPDTWTDRPDATDAILAELHDVTWPDEEWTDVEVCPRLDLDPHESWRCARASLRRARRQARTWMRSLRYGPVLMRATGGQPEFRTQVRREACRAWLRLLLPHRISVCPCGSWHVSPIFSWRRGA